MKKRKRRGFTLVEMMIAMMISALVMGGAMAFYMFGQRATRSTVRQVRAKQDGYGLVERLSMNLREAYLVQIFDQGDTVEITDRDGDGVQFRFDPGPDDDNYTVEDNVIWMMSDISRPDLERVIARNVSKVYSNTTGAPIPVFSRVDNKITVMLRIGDSLDSDYMDRVTGPGRQGYEIQTTVFLRNS